MDWVNIVLELLRDAGIGGFALVTLWAIWRFILKKCWVVLNDAATTAYVNESIDIATTNLKEKMSVLDNKIEQYNDRTFRQYNKLDGKIDNIYKEIIKLTLSGKFKVKDASTSA